MAKCMKISISIIFYRENIVQIICYDYSKSIHCRLYTSYLSFNGEFFYLPKSTYKEKNDTSIPPTHPWNIEMKKIEFLQKYGETFVHHDQSIYFFNNQNAKKYNTIYSTFYFYLIMFFFLFKKRIIIGLFQPHAFSQQNWFA